MAVYLAVAVVCFQFFLSCYLIFNLPDAYTCLGASLFQFFLSCYKKIMSASWRRGSCSLSILSQLLRGCRGEAVQGEARLPFNSFSVATGEPFSELEGLLRHRAQLLGFQFFLSCYYRVLKPGGRMYIPFNSFSVATVDYTTTPLAANGTSFNSFSVATRWTASRASPPALLAFNSFSVAT